MSRSVDHLVETHRIARERALAGEPIWAYTFDVSDLFHNEELTFEQRRDKVVGRLRASRFYSSYEEFQELAFELENCSDADSFDEVWGWFYDEADTYRVWVKTR